MDEMDELSRPVTRGELKTELADFARRSELDERFERIDERFERIDQRFEQLEQSFERNLEIWGGALNAKINASTDALRADFTRGLSVMLETIRGDLRASSEPYRDLPPRVDKLEALPERVARLEDAVFAPKPK
jgi:hypothetical protein